MLFISYDGEETGRIGSFRYAANPAVPIAKTVLSINMDMLARPHLEVGKANHLPQWASQDAFAREIIAKANDELGTKVEPGYREISVRDLPDSGGGDQRGTQGGR